MCVTVESVFFFGFCFYSRAHINTLIEHFVKYSDTGNCMEFLSVKDLGYQICNLEQNIPSCQVKNTSNLQDF